MAMGRGFRWEKAEWGDALVCEALLELAPHVFTTRRLAGTGPLADLEQAHAAVARHLGVSHVGRARQVHGVAAVLAQDGHPTTDMPADILVATDPARAVAVRVADCVPILIADRRTRGVAAVHAGWRGTAAGAAGAAVRAMQEWCRSRPKDLLAAVGPSIGPCCYQVGDDVRGAFAAGNGRALDVESWFLADGNRWRLDLWSASRDQLLQAGLSAGHVFVAGECTASHLDRYCSYRAEGARAGRLLAAIRPRGTP
jgi:YfiH family protein